MSKHEDFFIGWKGSVSANQKKRIRSLLLPIFTAVPILILAIVYFTKPFGDGVFELGKVKEFSGVYYEKPFPVLQLDEGQLPEGNKLSALLVGFGKSGAVTWMQDIEKKKGSLDGKKLKIQGTLINGDGRALIELTKRENSVVEVYENWTFENIEPALQKTSVEGEIVDPKCWFGVMKPAEGKVHKSCAIRCISGGIPPVLRVKDGEENEYYVLKGEDGEDINKDVLQFIGEPIATAGQSYEVNGWKVLQVDPKEIRYKND